MAFENFHSGPLSGKFIKKKLLLYLTVFYEYLMRLCTVQIVCEGKSANPHVSGVLHMS
jgi:hypothetical protein